MSAEAEMDTPLYGGVEAGGTKMVCAVGTGPGDIRAETRFPTTTPAETIARMLEFFREQNAHEKLAAVGVASFGPIDPNPSSATFGYITSTPKAGWANTDLAGPLAQELGVPVGFDTDVNGAALGEYRWGAAQGMQTFVYLTIGTGIGGGAMAEGRLVHGLLHPEVGHIRIPHDLRADPFPGVCPFHGDCFEGLACGPSVTARWSRPSHELPSDHPAWQLEAHYIALALNNLICALSPQRIVLGGGIMQQEHLFPLVRREVQHLLNGYIQAPSILSEIDSYIVPPGLGNQAGVLGAIALAQMAAGR
jgi:fructokinase